MRTPFSIFAASARTGHAPRLLAAAVLVALVVLPSVAFSSDVVVATVPVGLSPDAVAVDPVTHHVFVGNYYGDSVTVIDGVSDSVDATVPMPTGGSLAVPIAVVSDPLNARVYVGNFWSNFVSVIDGTTFSRIATISPPASHAAGVRALALDSSGVTPKVYAAIFGKQLVSVIDGSTNAIVANIPVGDSPRALAAFASGMRRRVYVANRYSNNVSIIDGNTDSVVATVPTGAGPKAIAVDPDRGFAYVSSPASDTVTVIDDSDQVTATIAVGDNPIGVAVDSTRRRVFVADYLQNAVSVIDADSLSVVATVPTGVNPYAVAVDQSAGRAFVSCYGNNVVTVIDPTLATVTVATGVRPYALGVDEGLAVHKTFVGNWGGNSVSVIDPAVGGSGPVTVTVDPLPGDTTASAAPTMTGTAVSTRSPHVSNILAVFFRLDADVAWRRAGITDGLGTPEVRWSVSGLGPLADGAHTLQVAAMDQALAMASSSDQGAGGASAALGSPAKYAFSVAVPPPAPPSTGLAVAPAVPDGDNGWYRSEPSVTLTADQPVPTYYGWDAPPALIYSGPVAAPIGSHTLSYLSGDASHGYEATRTRTVDYDPVIPFGPVLSDVNHMTGVWSNAATIVAGLSGAGDADSGLAGCSALWSTSATAVPDGVPDVPPLASTVSSRVAEGTWYLAVRPRDVAGNLGAVVRRGPYPIDLTPPATTDDAAARYAGTAIVHLTATDTASGVAESRYRLDGGPWVIGDTVATGLGTHSLDYFSTDVAGNAEGTRHVSFAVFARYEENDPAIRRRGRWIRLYDPALSQGAAIWADSRGCWAEMTFTGTSVEWSSPTGPYFGVARVIVDGGPPAYVDLYSPGSVYGRRVWSRYGLAPGAHTVRIEWTGIGHGSKRARIGLDAFDVDGPLVSPVMRLRRALR
ncbi:MAG TPA: cytochrome D1 domain-containing protein [Coriobacteriia bacterium]|jgi:YVTN family beta-propeller protein